MTKKIIFSDTEQKRILELYANGCGCAKIGSMLNLGSRTPIERFLKERGIKLTNKYPRIYSHNANYFHSIDTEEKAYWLGFLYADGNVHRTTIKITLGEKDKNHLVKFNEALNNSNPISINTQNAWGKEVKTANAIINCTKMCQDLISLGCVPKKSLVLKFPTVEQVPKALQIPFIRGYVDGDGSINVTNGKWWAVSMVGTYNMMSNIKQILGVEVKILKEKRSKCVYELSFGGNLQVLEKLEVLYANSRVYLDRKYELYKSLKLLYPKQKIESHKNLSSRFR